MPEFRFDNLNDFLAMGGYAGYVWFSYLAFALVVVWNFWQPRLERKRIVRLLRAREHQQLHQAGAPELRKQQNAQQQQGPVS